MNEITKLFSSLLLLGAGFVGASLFGPPDLVHRWIADWSPQQVQDTQALRPLPAGAPAPPVPFVSLTAGNAASIDTAMIERPIAPTRRASWNESPSQEQEAWLDLSQPWQAETTPPAQAPPVRDASHPDAWKVPDWSAPIATAPSPQRDPIAPPAWSDLRPTAEPSPFAQSELPSVRPVAPPAGPERTHVVTDGDTLALLAERYLGDSTQAKAILAMNSDRLSDPDLLPIGMILRLPNAPARSSHAVPHVTAWRGHGEANPFATISSESAPQGGHNRASRLTPIGGYDEQPAAPAPSSPYYDDLSW